ncbi:MAG TPA: hypothetical protein VLB76_27005 [Thermoanaerobaculia bacterium]|jgi:hypothetical protein|nr:hypothetical protein [Thermoanaerobaculia bacterium]
MTKALRKLLVSGLLLAIAFLTGGLRQAAAVDPCCLSCANQWAACVNTCNCWTPRGDDPCYPVYTSCASHCSTYCPPI